MKSGEVTLAVLADFSKAFDTVDYKTLISQLNVLGFSKGFIQLIDNYLTDRYQYVQVDDKCSSMLKVKFGVPQGSILGPILFNLYVTHLNINGPRTYLQYADNTTLLRHVKLKNLQQTVTSMQDEMNEIYNWSSSNNLQLNIAKTKLMLFSTKQMSRIHNLHDVGIKISSNNKNIERVNTIKILGVNFNEHLTWQDHIKCVLQNGFATLKTLKQFKRTADMNLKKSLVQSLVLSKIQYCNVVYSHAPDYLICRLQKLQRACRALDFRKW